VRPGIRCPIGEARITPAFKLPSKYIIHTVGPRWRGGSHGEAELLASCYRACLSLAVENALRTIAFPAISTGAFAYPLLDACRIAVAECSAFLDRSPSIDSVSLVAFNGEGRVALEKALLTQQR
jgi:O-acetyl-ADP-ribose deacetylase (regulator of RNase III)